MIHPSYLRVHIKKKSLSEEELKVLHIEVPHHLLYIVVLTLEEHFPIAQAPNRSLWVCIDSKDR